MILAHLSSCVLGVLVIVNFSYFNLQPSSLKPLGSLEKTLAGICIDLFLVLMENSAWLG